MAFIAALVDPDNPSQVIVFTDENFDGLNYADDATGWRKAMAAMCKTLEYAPKATSTTSHNFTPGSKTFQIVGGFGFAAGTAVRCANVAGTSYMDGLVTAIDLVAQSLTVNVLSIGAGSGANASWVITLGTSSSTIVSTPVSIANGGWAASTVAGGLANFELVQAYRITSVLSTPPGSPSNNQRHLVGASPTGAWVGHEHQIATYVTGTGWTFLTPNTGDAAIDLAQFYVYDYVGTAQYTRGIYTGSKWVFGNPVRSRWSIGSDITANYSVVSSDHGVWHRSLPASSNITITLPMLGATSGINGMEIVIETSSSNGFSTTILISGGSNIRLADGSTAASIVVAASTYKRYHLVAGQSGTDSLWYVWS